MQAARQLDVIPFTDRQPPYAPEAEVSVLGSMMIDGEAVAKALCIVDDQSFYRESNRRVFRAMCRMFQRGEVIEWVGLREELSKTGELEHAGGDAYLAELIEAVPTAANVEYHARLVKERELLRRLIEAGSNVVRLGYETGERPVSEILDEAAQLVFEAVSKGNESGGLSWIKRDLWSTFEEIERLQQAKGGITGLSTGLIDLDEITGGLQPGDMITIGARPSMGKTALATGIAMECAIGCTKPVAFFSCEMSKQQLIQRMLCFEGRVDLSRLLKGRLNDDDYVRLAQAAGHLQAAPIYIDETSSLTITQLRARARQLKAEREDLALIVVDYIQLMDGTGENRQQEISKISRGLKSTAKELHVPLIALSQLSRKNEDRGDKKPQLSDLRESGSLEQDSDIVGLLHRPEYYFGATRTVGKGKNAHEENLQGKAELIIAKQRNGPTDTLNLFYRKEQLRFESWANDGR